MDDIQEKTQIQNLDVDNKGMNPATSQVSFTGYNENLLDLNAKVKQGDNIDKSCDPYQANSLSTKAGSPNNSDDKNTRVKCEENTHELSVNNDDDFTSDVSLAKDHKNCHEEQCILSTVEDVIDSTNNITEKSVSLERVNECHASCSISILHEDTKEIQNTEENAFVECCNTKPEGEEDRSDVYCSSVSLSSYESSTTGPPLQYVEHTSSSHPVSRSSSTSRSLSSSLTLPMNASALLSNHDESRARTNLPSLNMEDESFNNLMAYSDIPALSIVNRPLRINSPKCMCRYRSQFAKLSPPCYLCSTTDLPPKYQQGDVYSWQNAMSKFFNRFQNSKKQNVSQPLSSEPHTSGEQNGSPFTISNGRIVDNIGETIASCNDLPRSLPSPTDMNDPSADGALESSEPTQNCSQPEETQFYATNSTEANNGRFSHHHISNEMLNSHRENSSNSNIILRTTSSDPPPYQLSERIAPPYSPPTPASQISGYSRQHGTVENQQPYDVNMARVAINRSCQSNVIYSFLLGVVTAVSIFGTETPVLMLASAVIFFTFIIYMPLIWAISCLLQWRTERTVFDGIPTNLGRTFYTSSALP